MADMNQESIQQKIQIARRDAEALKDRIKRKKDELADTTRKTPARYAALRATRPNANPPVQFAMSQETASRPCRASP
jgi:hypothetical protein